MAARVSSFCSGAECVEVERIGDVIVVGQRSRRGRVARQEVHYSLAEWNAFLAGAKRGEFDPAELLR